MALLFLIDLMCILEIMFQCFICNISYMFFSLQAILSLIAYLTKGLRMLKSQSNWQLIIRGKLLPLLLMRIIALGRKTTFKLFHRQIEYQFPQRINLAIQLQIPRRQLLLLLILQKQPAFKLIQIVLTPQSFIYSNMISNSYSLPNQKLHPHIAPCKNIGDEIRFKIEKGNIDKVQKQNLEYELSLIANNKKNRQNKNRFREDAKFSSDDEQPSAYIKNEYLNSIMQKGSWFVEGSLLKVKSCRLAVFKDKGKVDLQVEVLTQQSHKTILTQLFDPAFSKLQIKKDKDQQQIIKYLQQSTKNYKYLVCWFQALHTDQNQSLKSIAMEANERKRILGWQGDHIKLHIMSMKQFKQIKRFKCPQRVSSESAKCFSEERLLMIMQYPQKIQKIRHLYQPFSSIVRVTQEYYATVPFCEGESIQERSISQNWPAIQRPVFQQIVYQGWDNDQTQVKTKSQEVEKPLEPNAICRNKPDDRVSQIMQHFGIKNFEQILTDEQVQEPKDLATQLLNSITTVPVLNPLINPMRQTIPHQLQGYNRGYQPGMYSKRDYYSNNYSVQYYRHNQGGGSLYPKYSYLPPNEKQLGPYPQYFKSQFQSPHYYSKFNPRYEGEIKNYPTNYNGSRY